MKPFFLFIFFVIALELSAQGVPGNRTADPAKFTHGELNGLYKVDTVLSVRWAVSTGRGNIIPALVGYKQPNPVKDAEKEALLRAYLFFRKYPLAPYYEDGEFRVFVSVRRGK
jgi:hypothetical protein